MARLYLGYGAVHLYKELIIDVVPNFESGLKDVFFVLEKLTENVVRVLDLIQFL